jgi:hypothetical protein
VLSTQRLSLVDVNHKSVGLMFVYEYAGPIFDNEESLHSPRKAKYQLSQIDYERLECIFFKTLY